MLKNRIQPRFVLVFWLILQKLIRMFYHVKPLKDNGNSILAVKLGRHNGHPITLADAFEIKPGDRIIELHLNNDWFKKMGKLNLKTTSSIRESLRCAKQDLGFLAEQIGSGIFDKVTVLHGITPQHAVAKRLGFQVDDLPNTLLKKAEELYIAGLMQIYFMGTTERFRIADKPLELKEIWLSKAALLKKYGSTPANSPVS